MRSSRFFGVGIAAAALAGLATMPVAPPNAATGVTSAQGAAAPGTSAAKGEHKRAVAAQKQAVRLSAGYGAARLPRSKNPPERRPVPGYSARRKSKRRAKCRRLRGGR